MDVTIVIPVKNGGVLFSQVLDAINKQKTTYTYEIIIIDSGSKDDSVNVARKHNARVYEISPEEFGHGKTRNLGASYGTGKYIVFLAQDALPASNDWLQNLVEAMERDDNIAGGFGKHLPYPDCNIPDQQMLENHFARYGNDVFVHELTEERRKEYFDDEGYRQYLSFFSDNCSILRRDVWEKIPYQDVDFSEDQIWAREILEKGYKKVYVPNAAVYHSHSYPLKSYGKRYYDEFKALYKVQQANYCPDLLTYIKKVIGDTKYQWGYIRHRKDLHLKEKIYWYRYAFIRNTIRYKAAIHAVNYFKLSEKKQRKMDQKYSQQYKMIRE